jgi:hypothetical protein
MALTASRRGNVFVVGLMLGTLLGFSALSVDLGLIRVSQTQLQAAIDSAAMSGAGRLDGTSAGITAATSTAIAVAALNPVNGVALNVATSDVKVGTYDEDAKTFTVWDGISDPGPVNAVVVDHTPAQLKSILGGIAFGKTGYTIKAKGTAIRPVGSGAAASTKCFLPIAVPDCWVAGLAPGTNPPPFKFELSPSPTDDIAWGDPDGNPSTDDVRDQFLGACDHSEIAVDDPIYVNEGIHDSALQTVTGILNDMAAVAPTTWDTTLYGQVPARDGTHANNRQVSEVLQRYWGNTIEGPVALVNAGSDCNNVSFTGSLSMTGVAWATLYDVSWNQVEKNVWIQLDTVNEHDIWGTVDKTKTGNVLAYGEPTLVNY